MTLKRVVEFSPAWDRREEGYGIHSVTLRMILKSENAAVQFVLYTMWYLPHNRAELDKGSRDHFACQPMPADLGYHSPTPRYSDDESRECDVLKQGFCYYDGSGLNARDIYKALLERGSEGVWEELEKYYKQLFDNE